jgi:hypothetical protein
MNGDGTSDAAMEQIRVLDCAYFASSPLPVEDSAGANAPDTRSEEDLARYERIIGIVEF